MSDRESIQCVLNAVLFELPTFSGRDIKPEHDEPMLLMKHVVLLLRWLLGEFDEWPLEKEQK